MTQHDDPFDLQRFVDAQAGAIDRARDELSRGRKASHWMWFVFPQIEGLGHSAMARRYAITSPKRWPIWPIRCSERACANWPRSPYRRPVAAHTRSLVHRTT